jgi:subtilase family serine protease
MYTNCFGVGVHPIESNQIKIQPNPVNSEFYINVNQSSNVVIYDQMGRIVSLFSLDGDNLSQKVQCSSWSKGVYFLQVTTNTQTQKIKFIKE